MKNSQWMKTLDKKLTKKEFYVIQILTISEIKKKFLSEWILISNPETNSSLEVLKGRVAFHSKDRDEVYRAASRKKLKKFATFYTGKILKDAAVVL